MPAAQQQLEAAIQALEAQRALLGDAVVDASLGALRARLAALASPTEPAVEPTQTLKQVSILFLDVVGSTTLAQQLDPEDISAVMDDALARGTTVVEQHGGKVLQYAGDNILAAFGSEASAEDDAERAVRCGLALLALGRTLGAEVQAAHGHAGFNVRVGLHTGGVLLGGGVDAEGTIRGIAVNVAARMEQTAPAGALRISHDTYVHVRGLFDVEAQAPLSVKGVDAPIQSYLVNGAKPRSFRIGTRGIEGVATRMVGRDAELRALQGAFEQLFQERTLAIVTVVADAGVGKSRLLHEFEAWAEAQPESFFLFRGRATPRTGTQAYGLLRDILAWRFQIADDDSIAAARQKMEDGIVPLFLHDDGPDLAEGHAHLLGHLIGIEWKDSRHLRGILDDPGQIRSRALHAAAQLFRRLSASDGSPVVLQLEDLHWADGESLDFLIQLAEVNRDVPLLVLAFTRPTLFERATGWGGTPGRHPRIDLQPLDRRASRELADELLHKLPEIPAALRELLASSAEGNPFYMEELVKMLIDQGVIQTGEAWQVDAERLLVTQVPGTLTGVLQARLDGLPAPERRALQQASVVGAVFWDQALAAVDALAIELLPALTRRELALPRPEAPLEGLREYAFRHHILHQVTYDTVLKRARREGHAKVAQWLAGLTEQGSLRGGDFLGLAAEHFELAGDAPQACEYYARAAAAARRRYAHDAVLTAVASALPLLAQCGEGARAALHWRLLDARERTLDLLGRRAEQRADLQALGVLADTAGDDRRRAELACRASLLAMLTGDLPGAERDAREAMARAAVAGDRELQLNGQRLLAGALARRGHVTQALPLAEDGLAQARAAGWVGLESRFLNALTLIHARRNDLQALRVSCEQATRLRHELGDRRNEAIGRATLGGLWLAFGQLERAAAVLDEALRLHRAVGDRSQEPIALAYRSQLARWRGRAYEAGTQARDALAIAVEVQARVLQAFAGCCLGEAVLALDASSAPGAPEAPDAPEAPSAADVPGARAALDEARTAFAAARDAARAAGSGYEQDARGGLARVALRQGRLADARAEVEWLLARRRPGRGFEGAFAPRAVELGCWQVLDRVCDPRAASLLQEAACALRAEAAAITDPELRRGMLEVVPEHRAILAADAAQSNASGG